MTMPILLKYSLRFSSVVSPVRPPMKILNLEVSESLEGEGLLLLALGFLGVSRLVGIFSGVFSGWLSVILACSILLAL